MRNRFCTNNFSKENKQVLSTDPHLWLEKYKRRLIETSNGKQPSSTRKVNESINALRKSIQRVDREFESTNYSMRPTKSCTAKRKYRNKNI